MMDLGGGGRRSPPNLWVGAGGVLPPADGCSGRSFGGGSGLSRGSDGCFCSLSRSSEMCMDDRPVVAAHDVSLGMYEGYLARDQAASPKVRRATGSTMLDATCSINVQMVDDGLLNGIFPSVTVFVKKQNIFPSGSADPAVHKKHNSFSKVVSVKPAIGLTQVASTGSRDEPMLDNGLTQGTLPSSGGFVHDDFNLTKIGASNFSSAGNINVVGNEGCLPLHNSVHMQDFSPTFPVNFCFGSAHGKRPVQVIPAAPTPRPPGVRGNSPSNSMQNVPAGHVAEKSQTPFHNSTNAWSWPKVVRMPSLVELGQFSCNGSTVLLDNDEVAAMTKKFDSALVGRLFGRRLLYTQLTRELKLRWAAYDNFKIVTMSSDCFICFFNSVESRDAVLLGGPWVVLGQVLGIDRWSLAFSPSSSTGFCTPVWVRLPRLPLYCWSARNIGRIGALLGEPLWLDSATEQLERGLYARVCVRIDLSKPLRFGIWVDGCYGRFFQSIEYECLSIFCCRCGHVGHKELFCKLKAFTRVTHSSIQPSNATPIFVQKQVVNIDGECVQQPVSFPSNSPPVSLHDGVPPPMDLGIVDPLAVLEGDRGVGPWMMAARKKRPNKKVPARHSPPPLPV